MPADFRFRIIEKRLCAHIQKESDAHNRPKFYAFAVFLTSATAPFISIACGFAGLWFFGRFRAALGCSGSMDFLPLFFCAYLTASSCSAFAGWFLGTFIALPPAFFARYSPLAMPPLLAACALSLYLRFVDPRFDFAIYAVFVSYSLWLWFFIGFLLGVRKKKTASGRGNGLRLLAVFIALCALLAGANIYPIIRDTIYWDRKNTGNGFEIGNPYSGAYYEKGPAMPEKPPSLRIASKHPRLGADEAGLAIMEAVALAVYDLDENSEKADAEDGNMESPDRHVTQFMDSKIAFDLLLDDKIDIFIGLAPCAGQLDAAMAQRIRVFPVALEALVFLVHKDNPVQGLSLQEARDIYSGRMRRWSELRGIDAKILAFQRHENAPEQQAMLDMVMGGATMTKPLREEYFDPTGGFPACVNKVADYRNLPNALGYSFRWLAKQRFLPEEIRFLAVDGVWPTDENISSGKYPLTVSIVAAVSSKMTPPMSNLLEWLTGAEGQRLISRTGYAPLNPAFATSGKD